MSAAGPEAIAIVGMQCVFPGARDLVAFWRNIIRGVDATGEVPPTRWRPEDHETLLTTRGGFIDELTEFDPLEHGIMPAALEGCDPEQFLVFGVVYGALRDAAAGRRWRRGEDVPAPGDLGPLPQRAEVVVGRGGHMGNAAEDAHLRMEFAAELVGLLRRLAPAADAAAWEDVRRRLRAGFPPGTAEMIASSIPSLTSGRVANRLDFLGPNYTVDAACASALVATEHVVRSLRDRRCDLGIAAGVHLVQKPHFWYAFELLQAPSRTGRCRPFAADADGLLIGEGLGAVVLKRLSDAERDGDRVYAVLRAVTSGSDGRGMGILTPRADGQVLAMRRAYEEAGIDPASVTVLEGHGTAMPVGDTTEITALHQMFGKDGDPEVALGSVKSMIGHAMPAAGMAGLIKTALAVYHRVLPPTLHVEQPHPELRGGRLYVNTRPRPWVMPEGTPRRAGVNAFGFGGINCHALLEDLPGDAPRQSLTPRSSELFLMTAPSREEMLCRVEAWLAVLPALADEDLADVAFSECRRYTREELFRLAVVAATAADLAAKLGRARERLRAGEESAWCDEAGGIYFAAAPYPGKMAVVFPGLAFPGLAGGYTERLGEMCLHFPEARAYLDLADALAERTADIPYPLRHQFFPPPLSDAATFARLERELIWSRRTCLGQMMAALATWRLVRSLGVRPDALAGFSLGEWGALVAGGVIDHEGLKQILEVWKSLGSMPEEIGGIWGLVGAPADDVEPVLLEVPGTATIIMDTTSSQTFFAGEPAAVRAALDHFRKRGVYSQEIPFAAIHTPLARPLVEGLKAMRSAIPVRPPSCPVYCGMNGQPYPDDPEQIRDWLIESNVEPLRGREAIRRMYADGVRVFVEIGIGARLPQSVLGFLGDAPHVCVSLDWRREDGGLAQLHHLLARLAVLGVAFEPRNLYRGRPCRGIDPFGIHPAARKRAPALSLTPPRFPVADSLLEDIRKLVVPELPNRAEKPEATPAPSPATVPGLLQESLATLEKFLQVQQQHEEAEARLLTRYLEAQETALAAFLRANGSAPTNAARPSCPTAPPLLGQVRRLVPGQELETELKLDIDQHLYLRDHSFVQVPEALRPAEERLPRLPLTFGAEIFAAAASLLAPDRTAVAIHDLEASRWVALESTRSIAATVRAQRISDEEVEAELLVEGQDRPAIRGHVTVGRALPSPPAAMSVACDQPCPSKAEDIYRKPWLFHGPRFHVITALNAMSEDAVTAALTLRDPAELFATPPAGPLLFDPVLVDGLGQVLGWRLLLDGIAIYPFRLGRLTRYRPTPPPGTEVQARMRYRRADGRRFVMDADVLDADGRLWLRLEGWQVWRMLWPRDLAAFIRTPRDCRLSVPCPPSEPGRCAVRVTPDLLGEISPDWIARYCLTAREWAAWRRRPEPAWLFGMLAVKDAVRDWYRQHRGQALLHLEVEIADGPDGLPVVAVPAGAALTLSLRVGTEEAVAEVAEEAGYPRPRSLTFAEP